MLISWEAEILLADKASKSLGSPWLTANATIL